MLFRATSIIPLENMTPVIMPRLATVKMTKRGATCDPMAEFRKFTASLVTPTIRSKTANTIKMTTATSNHSSAINTPVWFFSNYEDSMKS